MYFITGIGSRETPANILAEMTKIGEWCSEHAVWVRSGHADGADWAFEQGAKSYTSVYLPWPKFNVGKPLLGSYTVCSPNQRLDEITKQFHPAYNSLSDAGRLLMYRNVLQVLGQNLDLHSDAVVCWTKDWKNPSGGTSQAIRIAEHYGITVINMNNPKFDTASKVTTEVGKILGWY